MSLNNNIYILYPFIFNLTVSHTRASVFWIGSFECVMYDLRVMIKQADITEEHVDAIVNCTSDDLDLNTGKLCFVFNYVFVMYLYTNIIIV